MATKKPEGKLFYVAVAQPKNSNTIEALNTFEGTFAGLKDAAACAGEALPKYHAAWVETIEVKDPKAESVTILNFTVGVK